MTRRVDHIQGHTYHGRKGDIENAFRYSIDYVLTEPEAQTKGPSLFGRNRRGLASLYDRDHGGAPKAGTGAVWARQVLAAHDVDPQGRIELLAQPRFWGHVFNPVSFWLCYNPKGALCVVIAEVSNTYGDRHSYLCHKEDLSPLRATDEVRANKIFYVSPFQKVDGEYVFRFDIRDDRIGVWIDYRHGNAGLIATLVGRRVPMTNRSILWACVRRPFGSRRVLGLIHWQALKLWWKGAQFKSRPPPPEGEVSK